jgi:hypothetical protein
LRTERFEWSRMGPITLAPAPLDVILQPTFWFAYPVDVPSGLAKHGRKVLGRRILCVFGDLGPLETIAEIEAWRALYQR